jgi:hypothetical protein
MFFETCFFPIDTLVRLPSYARDVRKKTYNIVTCGPIARERGDKHVSMEVDFWRPARYETRFRVNEWSTHISLDTATLYKWPFRQEPSHRMSHKDYYPKSSVEKISGPGSQGAWRQDELIGCKRPVVK